MRVLVVTVPVDAAELASDRLWAAGAAAVEERAAEPGRVELRTTLGADDAASQARIGELPAGWRVSFDEVADEPAETWRRFAQAVVVSDELVIAPAWVEVGDDAAPTVVRIEPDRAFGLGDHPTTRLSAAVVHEVVGDGDRVLDVGCGSGVLAIIAAVRGAAEIVAVDIADAAREATVDNAARNGVGDRISVSTTPVGGVAGEFDVVAANILAPALVSMAPELRRLTAADGRLVVSGVLTGGYDEVVEALAPMRPTDERHLDGWSAVVLRHEQR